MDLNRTYHVYIGIDYDSLPSNIVRKKFSSDALEICELLNLPENCRKSVTSRITQYDLKKIISSLNSENYKGYDILIYLSGHGHINDIDDESLLLTSDSTEDFYIGVPFTYIFEQINKNEYPNNIAVILDCCHSGIHNKSARENSYWISAASKNTTVDNQFHETIIDYFKDHDNLTITGLMDYLQTHLRINQPKTTINTSNPFYISKHKSEIISVYEFNKFSLLKRGRLRTAYPMDICFSEIFKQKLYIEPKLLKNSEVIELNYFLNQFENNHTCLILGNPGSGKSFFSYLVQNEFLKLNQEVIALQFEELNNIFSFDKNDGHNDNNYLIKVFSEIIESSKLQKMILIIDGLDEYNKWEKNIDSFLQLTNKISVIAFSRDEEYFSNVSNYIPINSFDSVYCLKDWEYEKEFVCYLDLLLKKQILDAATASNILGYGEKCKSFLTTPLYSRMFIYAFDSFSNQTDLFEINKTSLYLSYFQKLANRFNINSNSTIDFWKKISFDAFIKGHNNYTLLKEEVFVKEMQNYDTDECRTIKTIIQLKRCTDGAYYNFIHYSFFEFFIALALCSRIKTCFLNRESPSVLNIFGSDLSSEIRHYLVNLLGSENLLNDPFFILFLLNSYELNSEEKDTKNHLVKMNLIIYFLSKCYGEEVLQYLKKLLLLEENDFLKNSLYWACIRKNDEDSFIDYITLLEVNISFKSYNRGYHMFYYGDLISDNFPFMDVSLDSSWYNTRSKLMENRIKINNNNSSLMLLLDIYTFLDFSLFHKTNLEEIEVKILNEKYLNLAPKIPNEVKKYFENMINLINGVI